MSETVTGRSLLFFPSRPSRYLLRQAKTWLALIAWRCATRATDASAQCLFNDSSFLFDRSPPPFYVTNRLNRPLLGSVHLFLVDTYRCAHIGQHPYLFTLSPDGSYQTLTQEPHNPRRTHDSLHRAKIVIQPVERFFHYR
jgi:hypothetical protein